MTSPTQAEIESALSLAMAVAADTRPSRMDMFDTVDEQILFDDRRILATALLHLAARVKAADEVVRHILDDHEIEVMRAFGNRIEFQRHGNSDGSVSVKWCEPDRFWLTFDNLRSALTLAHADAAVLRGAATVLWYQVKALMEFHDDHEHKPCGEYGAECPIGMGEWFDKQERTTIAEAAATIDSSSAGSDLLARLRVLEYALMPFSAAWRHFEKFPPLAGKEWADGVTYQRGDITLGDLRRAATALGAAHGERQAMSLPTPAQIAQVANAILGTLAAPDVPPITNPIALLTSKNRAKIMEQARVAIQAWESIKDQHTP